MTSIRCVAGSTPQRLTKLGEEPSPRYLWRMPELVNSNVASSEGSPGELGGVAELEARAEHVAARLAEVANAKRLLILCHLAKCEAEGGTGEASVGELQRAIGLSQSALSQHLARLRAAGMVATRRASQTIHYRLGDEETRVLMRALYDTFCAR